VNHAPHFITFAQYRQCDPDRCPQNKRYAQAAQETETRSKSRLSVDLNSSPPNGRLSVRSRINLLDDQRARYFELYYSYNQSTDHIYSETKTKNSFRAIHHQDILSHTESDIFLDTKEQSADNDMANTPMNFDDQAVPDLSAQSLQTSLREYGFFTSDIEPEALAPEYRNFISNLEANDARGCVAEWSEQIQAQSFDNAQHEVNEQCMDIFQDLLHFTDELSIPFSTIIPGQIYMETSDYSNNAAAASLQHLSIQPEQHHRPTHDPFMGWASKRVGQVLEEHNWVLPRVEGI
jgi:hypothetical protein